MTEVMKKALKENEGRGCELCGRTKTLEAHHIIPRSIGGPDSEDNIICICSACHAKLTPKSLLTKIGLRNSSPRYFFYKHFNELAENHEIPCFEDVCDYLEQYVFPIIKNR